MPRNRLKELREDHGMSLQALAERIAPPVHQSTISRWESGIHQIPDDAKQQLAELFGVSVSHLMAWDEPNGDSNGDSTPVVAV